MVLVRFLHSGNFISSHKRSLYDFDHMSSTVTTQQPSLSHSLLRSSTENLASLTSHPPITHSHGLNVRIPSQVSQVYPNLKKNTTFNDYRRHKKIFFIILFGIAQKWDFAILTKITVS